MISDEFGPHGGTIRIHDYIDYIRIDIEEFSTSVVTEIQDEVFRERLYQNYYENMVFPQIKKSYKNVTSLESKIETIDEKPIFYALARVSEGQPFRSTLLYSDGNYIYSFTTLDIDRGDLGWSLQKKMENAYLVALGAFKKCTF